MIRLTTYFSGHEIKVLKTAFMSGERKNEIKNVYCQTGEEKYGNKII